MTRRRTSFGLRCWQIAGVGVLLYGTAFLLHAVVAWIFGIR